MPKSPEFEELAQLLKSWNVSELLPYLQDEAINTQELQMLKRHHLSDMLRNFRYGTRIRFEHHLERWRRWLNMPLQDPPGTAGCATAAGCTSALDDKFGCNENNNNNNSSSNSGTHCNGNNNSGTHCNGCRCTLSESQHIKSHSKPDILDDSVMRQHQQQQQLVSEPFVSLNEVADGVAFSVPLPLSDHSELVHTELVSADLIKPEIGLDMDGSSAESGVTVLSILQASPVKAQTLLERLGHNEQLDAVQRLLLIQLICSYYEDNRLHLTLQRSHLLEREILQLFPKEQLCFYRTERRGKIYVRFTNMKRNKRFGNQREQKRRREESTLATQNTYMSKEEVTFGGDPMSSPERSD